MGSFNTCEGEDPECRHFNCALGQKRGHGFQVDKAVQFCDGQVNC